MKSRIITLSLFAAFALLVSCNDDTSPSGINGAWNLKNVRGGFQGLDKDYAAGEVTWTFKRTGSLVVENNAEPDDNYSGLSSGTYPYTIETINDKKTLFIDDSQEGVLLLEGCTMQIDEGIAVDGF